LRVLGRREMASAILNLALDDRTSIRASGLTGCRGEGFIKGFNWLIINR